MAKKRKQIARQVTPQKEIEKLLKSARSTAKQVNELTGSHREKLAVAVDKHHLHKGAFAVIKSLDKKEPEEIAAFLDHFHHYLDVSGIQKRADDAPDLGLEEGETSEDGKVTRAKFGDGEQAGAGGTPG